MINIVAYFRSRKKILKIARSELFEKAFHAIKSCEVLLHDEKEFGKLRFLIEQMKLLNVKKMQDAFLFR